MFVACERAKSWLLCNDFSVPQWSCRNKLLLLVELSGHCLLTSATCRVRGTLRFLLAKIGMRLLPPSLGMSFLYLVAAVASCPSMSVDVATAPDLKACTATLKAETYDVELAWLPSLPHAVEAPHRCISLPISDPLNMY